MYVPFPFTRLQLALISYSIHVHHCTSISFKDKTIECEYLIENEEGKVAEGLFGLLQDRKCQFRQNFHTDTDQGWGRVRILTPATLPFHGIWHQCPTPRPYHYCPNLTCQEHCHPSPTDGPTEAECCDRTVRRSGGGTATGEVREFPMVY